MSVDVTSREYQQMAHLLRRAGFGADHETIQSLVQKGLKSVVHSLVYETAPDPLDTMLDRMDGEELNYNQAGDLQIWWLNRMVHSPNPLQEKMTLFWHGHFVSAYSKVNNLLMLYRQNQLFRRMGMGNFRDLTQAVSKDPAMIWYLDNQYNRKGHANENYGRELMELFTLGIGHYTEEDVRQNARAFTGWGFNRLTAEYQFNPEQHDDGIKTVLGQTGSWNGNDIVDILMKQPSLPSFICTKLYKFFVSDNASPEDVKPYADIFASSGLKIQPVLEAMFLSPEFYSEKVMWQKFKTPTEFVVDAIRSTGTQVSLRPALFAMRAMGQELFNAPSVKGWDGGVTWINTNTLFARFQFCMQLARMNPENSPMLAAIEQTLLKGEMQTPEDVVDYYATRLLHRRLDDHSREVLVNYLNTNRNGEAEPFQIPTNARTMRAAQLKIHGLMHMVMVTPEFQLV